MEIKQTFTGISPTGFKWNKNEILWLVSVWVAFIVWAYLWESYVPVIVLAVLTGIAFLIRLPGLKRKIEIKISDNALSIHEGNAVLWKTGLQDITSIELEEKQRAFSKATNKALLIRNNKNDSYFLPLDGMAFEGLEPDELVENINQAVR